MQNNPQAKGAILYKSYLVKENPQVPKPSNTASGTEFNWSLGNEFKGNC
jgi:hypothetical protein